jgi:hypothetical protein
VFPFFVFLPFCFFFVFLFFFLLELFHSLLGFKLASIMVEFPVPASLVAEAQHIG